MNPLFKVSLFITSTMDRERDLFRFLNCLSLQTTKYPINLYFVNQSTTIPDYNWLGAVFKTKIISSNRLSLSAARNLALSHIAPLNDSCEIIGFPDDDCWYTNDLIEKVIDYFHSNPQCNCLCTNVFDPKRNKSYGHRPLNVALKVNYNNLFKLPISVGIFIRRDSSISQQLFFDENLGAGTKLGSGEETDLIARLLELKCRIDYNGAIQVYHPVIPYLETDISKYELYSRGFGYLVARLLKNKHYIVVLYFVETLLRSLIGAIVYIFNSIKRNFYLGRVKGMSKGLIQGFRK